MGHFGGGSGAVAELNDVMTGLAADESNFNQADSSGKRRINKNALKAAIKEAQAQPDSTIPARMGGMDTADWISKTAADDFIFGENSPRVIDNVLVESLEN